jgi:phage gp36-like protein
MRYLNKLASVFCFATLGVWALTSCEGSDLYKVGSPDWVAAKADSIKNANQGSGEEELVGMHEDVYSVGAADFSTGWWAAFSKYYQIPAGQKWHGVFNLSINPSAPNTYKNYAMILCNDEDRGAANYKEYGAIRYDNQPSGNSEWGDYIDRSLVTSNLTFGTDTDAGVDKLGGRVVVTVDRTGEKAGFVVTMTNGTVTKTYTQSADMPNLNADASNDKIRVFFVPEGSQINFLQSNIEPIGGYTEAGDKMPLKLTLKSVPKKILQNAYATVEEAFANVTATVEFEQGVTMDVTAADLTFQAVPDLNSLGKKMLVAGYSKTYKGEGAPSPVIGTAEFEVVDKMYTLLGAADNSTPFFGARSGLVKIAPNETFITTFTNYTAGGSNWENYLVVLSKGDLSLGADGEYAVLRADNFGWGNGYGTCTATCSHSDWAAWLAAMNGGKVTVQVTNNGDGTADVEAVTVGSDANIYTQTYKGITVADPNDFYFSLTLEKAHLEFDGVLGNEDNTTPFFGAKSDPIKVPAGHTVTTRFRNYTNGGANWNNYLAVVCKADLTLGADGEYAVLRADNFGWGNGYGTCTAACDHADWAAWLEAMNEGLVTLSVTNKGDGTADVKAVTLGSDGKTYTQTYTGITVDASDVNFYLTMEGAHIVFE